MALESLDLVFGKVENQCQYQKENKVLSNF
jgi:hypothetical protein